MKPACAHEATLRTRRCVAALGGLAACVWRIMSVTLRTLRLTSHAALLKLWRSPCNVCTHGRDRSNERLQRLYARASLHAMHRIDRVQYVSCLVRCAVRGCGKAPAFILASQRRKDRCKGPRSGSDEGSAEGVRRGGPRRGSDEGSAEGVRRGVRRGVRGGGVGGEQQLDSHVLRSVLWRLACSASCRSRFVRVDCHRVQLRSSCDDRHAMLGRDLPSCAHDAIVRP